MAADPELDPASLNPSGAAVRTRVAGGRCTWKWLLVWLLVAILLGSVIGILAYFLASSSDDVSFPEFPPNTSSARLLLPTTIWPRAYNLQLQSYLEYNTTPNLTFLGTVQVVFDCFSSTNIIKFHAVDLNFSKESIVFQNLNGTENPRVLALQQDKYAQMIALKVRPSLSAGNQYVMVIREFHGMIRLDAKAFYLSTYQTAHGDSRLVKHQ